jgi:serine protease
MMIRSQPPGPRQSRLAAGCAGLLLGSWLALGAVPTPAAAGSTELPMSSPLATAAKPGAAADDSLEAPLAAATGAYMALSPQRLLDTRTTGQTLPAAGSLNLTVTGGSVPSAAIAVALNVTVTDTTASSYLSVYPAGETRPLLSNLNWVAGETVPNLVIVPIGSGGQVTFYNNTGSTDVVVDLEGYFAPEATGSTAGSYVPLAPARITDTRPASQEPNSGDTLGPGSTLDVQVTGEGAVPASGVAAALLNVTVTDTTSPGYLTVYPQGTPFPGSSNLNWVAGDTVPNRVVVPVGTSGQIAVFNQMGSTDVVVDVDGYFTDGTSTPAAASLFSPITPIRVLDTRDTGQTLGPGVSITQEMAGVDGIASNADAVVTNVTATDTTAPGYLTVHPGGTPPLASDLNWSPAQTVANLTVATLGGTGALSVFNDIGSVDVVIDAFGYFVPETPALLVITTASLPQATVGSPYSTTLAANGGTPPYSWSVASGSLPPGLSLAPGGVISGMPTAAGVASFTVQVTDSMTPHPATAAAELAISVAPPPAIASTNWSGYFVEGGSSGPFTGVTGTFTVPSLVAPVQAGTWVFEWVGIDGATNTSLIQAGVAEYGCGSQECLTPWWEVLPAAATDIPMAVAANDQVTVTIAQVSGSAWDITLADDTTGHTFSQAVTYTGPGASAEWIVEDPTNAQTGTLSPFADYTLTTFSGLGISGGPQETLTEAVMLQGATQLSTPSPWTASGFNVAYGDVAPPPP